MLSNTNLVVGFFNASQTVIGSTLIKPCPKKLQKIIQLGLGCHWKESKKLLQSHDTSYSQAVMKATPKIIGNYFFFL